MSGPSETPASSATIPTDPVSVNFTALAARFSSTCRKRPGSPTRRLGTLGASRPRDYDVAGDLAYQPLSLRVEDLQARALTLRPDLQAARRSVTSATSQTGLAKANAKI